MPNERQAESGKQRLKERKRLILKNGGSKPPPYGDRRTNDEIPFVRCYMCNARRER